MSRPSKYLSLPALALLLVAHPAAAFAQDLNWRRVKLDDAFRSEGVAVADVNRDGKNDVIAGDVWYEAPLWNIHEIRPPGKFVAGVGYSNSFVNFAHDLNGDGWDDLVLIGFPGDPFHWYENPQNKPGHWAERLIWHSACNESPAFLDITGDGRPELLLGSQPEAQMGLLPIPPAGKVSEKWAFHPVSRPGDPMTNGTFKYYHGLGAGDLNNDGRTDVLIVDGWWEAPQSPLDGTWEFHPYELKDHNGGPVRAANIHLDDLDLDGDNDLIASCAHSYGVWWFENTGGNQAPKFQCHLIDATHSQTHALEFVDIDGDGTKDIITGKRYYAHNGKDPGAEEPVVVIWYQIIRQQGAPPKFVPHEIEAGRETGIGTQFQVSDFDADGRPDIILSNKKGVNLLLQQRSP